MNKQELIEEVGSKSNYTLNEIREIVNATFVVIKERVLTGEAVTIQNFGRFYQKYSAAYNATDPNTGEPVSVPEKLRFKFKASKKLTLVGGE